MSIVTVFNALVATKIVAIGVPSRSGVKSSQFSAIVVLYLLFWLNIQMEFYMKVVRNFFMALSVVLGANITKAALYDVGGKVIICRKYLLKNYFRFLVLAISPLLLSACSTGGCSAFQVFPPRISVKDVKSQWVTGYTVSYKLADGATTEKVCEAASECVLDGIDLYSANSSITVSKNGFESVTAQPKEFIETYSNNDCTSQYTVAITLKALS